MHSVSSGAQFKMDDFESAFSQSHTNPNEARAKHDILPYPASIQSKSKVNNTDDEDFFSTSSRPNNQPLFSPASELFDQKEDKHLLSPSNPFPKDQIS